MDWVDLTQRLVAAARVSFSDLIAQRPGERFYAFILYTDADCYTALPSANSIEKHREKISAAGVEDRQDIAGYRWSIGEWAYEAWMDGAFSRICEDLSEASRRAGEAGRFAEFRQQVHASLIDALATLDAQGFFGVRRNEIVLFVSSSEYDEAMELENRSAQILNRPDAHAEFLQRYAV